MATHSNIVAWRIPWDLKETDTIERINMDYLYYVVFLSISLFFFFKEKYISFDI